jgi:chromosome segregation ATPase
MGSQYAQLNNLSENIERISNSINNIDTRLRSLEGSVSNNYNTVTASITELEQKIINEIYSSYMPNITAGIDALKPELRTYIRQIIKEELKNNLFRT